MELVSTKIEMKNDLRKKLFWFLSGLWFWGLVFGGNLVSLAKSSSTARTATALLIVLFSVFFSIYFFISVTKLFNEAETDSNVYGQVDDTTEII